MKRDLVHHLRELKPFTCLRREKSSFSSNVALEDNHGRFHNYLRISLTEKCNLRCVYCMPLEGVKLTNSNDLLNLEEHQRILKIFASLGVTKIRFTGGEPTTSKYLLNLIECAHQIPAIKSIGITTNGIMLKHNLANFVRCGLTHVNISLDTLVPEVFQSIVRRDGRSIYSVLSAIYESVAHGIHVKVTWKWSDRWKCRISTIQYSD